jgi:ParB-like chromosome segregation protein Spo0J
VAKKKTALGQTLFRDINPYGAVTAEGDTLPLASIRPDPGQPRRLLPADLAERVASGASEPGAAMAEWLRRAEQQLDANLVELHRLATSIEQHGLINAVTVRRAAAGEAVPAGVDYLLITGERRYWAFVLLALQGRLVHSGSEAGDPGHIPARIAPEGISVRAHQLIENLLREDINAVEKAEGLWALRYELSGVNDRSPLPEMVNDSSLEGEDGAAGLAPWKQVVELLGISKRYRIFLTSVLGLAPEALALVRRHNLAEMTIRPIVQKLRDRPALQLAALQQLITWQAENEAGEGPNRAITRSVQELVDDLLAGEAAEAAGKKGRLTIELSPQTQRFATRVRGALRFIQRLSPQDATLVARDLALDPAFAPTRDELAELRTQLDDLLQKVAHYQNPAQGEKTVTARSRKKRI